ncbi:post-GPI attachment to proteins factor 2 [Drosophila sulfurigaster albostrigata]|uniref:post-GPI attachment to proteins factor 2 n=1 Tax=Drosophila sulfurigaster albostrigata TaxID=89887 RepID=UPI002D21E6A2|nr:post-GPI attachment to proteins factor 2 [Drosophila sulfurigaster albostrigata]
MSDTVKLLPCSTKDLHSQAPVLRISIARLLLVGFAVPPFVLAYMIVNVMITDFEHATYTDCRVLNALPSVSAISRSQQLGWKLVTWMLLPLRALIIVLYWRYYRKVFRRAYKLQWLILFLFVYESLSTVFMARWTHISGDESIHMIVVCSIWLASFGYIGASFLCFKRHCNRFAVEPHQQLSYLLKKKCVIFYYSGTLAMWCCYPLHTEFCLPLAYTGFALAEYVVSWSLMGYLWTSAIDFYPFYLCRNAQRGFFLIST